MTEHTHSGSPRINPISIPQLRAVFNGRVIAPEDASYDEARAVFYGAREELEKYILPLLE